MDPGAKEPPTTIDIEAFSPPTDVAIAARDVDDLAHGESVRVDADDLAWPDAFSTLPPGDYWVQALLDTRRDYGHYGCGGGDLTGPVTRIHLDAHADGGTLVLDRALAESRPWVFDPNTRPFILEAIPHARENAHAFSFKSETVSAFAGRPTVADAWKRYDIVERLRAHPDRRLKGRLHVIVGAQDNYYLDAGVRRMAMLPGVTDVRILPGRDHNDLHKVGDDPLGLFRTMGAEMAKAVSP